MSKLTPSKKIAYIICAAAIAQSIQANAADDNKVGYAAGFLSDPFQSVLVKQTVDLAKSAGLATLPPSNANGDAAKQISDVRNLIAAGAKVLVLNPTDSKAIVPALNYAASKNVPVIAIDAAPSGGKVFMTVRADNIMMGSQACMVMGKALNGKGKVLSLMGDQATTNGRDRTVGFNDCMKKNFPEIKIIEQPTYWKADKATSIAQTVLTSNADLGGIFMQSDSVMLQGVMNVLKSAGKLVEKSKPGHIALVSIDGTPAALNAVRQGYLDASISQPLDLYVKHAVHFAQKALNLPTQANEAEMKGTIVEVDGNKQNLLPATPVDQSNVSDAALWGNSKL